MDWEETIQCEQQKRDAALGPAARWRLIMATITWIDEHQVHRNTPAACLQVQRAKLAITSVDEGQDSSSRTPPRTRKRTTDESPPVGDSFR